MDNTQLDRIGIYANLSWSNMGEMVLFRK